MLDVGALLARFTKAIFFLAQGTQRKAQGTQGIYGCWMLGLFLWGRQGGIFLAPKGTTVGFP